MTIEQWAKQFTAITASDIENFLETVDKKLSLHDKKRLFSEMYQDKIAFSYILQVEKKIVRDWHIEEIKEYKSKYGSGVGYGDRLRDIYGEGYGVGYGVEYHYGCGGSDPKSLNSP